MQLNQNGLHFGLDDLKSLWGLFPFKKKITKSNAFILFVDDENFPIVSTLASSGWNVKKVEDITNLQDENIKRAHIIFVDYKGVGKTLSPNDEGLGIIKAIKDTYKEKKRVLLYSAHSSFSLGKHLDWFDGQISKNSQAYEFINKIESELSKL